MKYRNGFVSNSSSSSFLMGIGKIKDIEKVKALVEGKDYFQIIAVEDLMDNRNVNLRGDKVSIESFDGCEISTKVDFEPGSFYLVMNYCAGGDSDFEIYDDYGEFCEYNYDIDIDFFGKQANESAIFYKHDLIEDGDISFGAGRDG